MHQNTAIRLICFIGFLFCSFLLKAQPYIDIFSVSYQRMNPSHVLSNEDKEDVTVDEFTVFANVPLKFDNDVLLISATYDQQKQSYKDSSYDQSLLSSLLAVTYIKQLKSEKWKLIIAGIPRFNSTDNTFSANTFQLGFAAMGIYQKNEKTKYRFGLYYNNEFFGPYFIPLIGIETSLNSKLKLFCLLPNFAHLEYKFSKSFYGGFAFRGITTSYRLENKNSFFRMDEGQLKLYLNYYFKKQHVFFLEFGHTANRIFQNGIRLEGKTVAAKMPVNESFIFKAGYAFRIRLDEQK